MLFTVGKNLKVGQVISVNFKKAKVSKIDVKKDKQGKIIGGKVEVTTLPEKEKFDITSSGCVEIKL